MMRSKASLPLIPPLRRYGRRRYLWILLLYGLLTLLLTYPLGGQLFTAAAGAEGRDSFQHVWYQWWLKETLLELGQWPDRVTYLYYPLGADHPVLALHPYVPLVSLPLTLLLGPLASYNIAFLLSFILAGLAGYLLCRYLCRQTGAALIGGLIFAFYPNRQGHAVAGHLLLITNYFLPLYALSLLILLKRPSPKIAAWHGLVAGLLALAQPTHMGYGILPIFLFVLGGKAVALLKARTRSLHPPAPSPLRPLPIAALVSAGLLAAAIFLPFAWPVLRQNQQGTLTYLNPNDLTEHSSDLLAFILPSPYNPILKQLGWIPAFSTSIIAGPRDLEEQLAYPGALAVALAGLALWRCWPAARLWFGLVMMMMLFSLGPWLKIAGEVQTVPLPYAWIARLPFFAWSRTPGRLNETVMLGVAVLAALGAAWLLKRLGYRRVGPLIALMILILLEYLVVFPFPLDLRPAPAYYYRLAQQALTGGVLEMPVSGSRRASNYAMYYQTIHQHPLAGGYIERDPPGTVELKEFLNQLVSPLPAQMVFPSPGEAQRRAILADLKIQHVIAHPALMTDQAARATRDYLPVLLGQTIFADAEIAVYIVPPGLEQHLPAWQMLPDQEGWEVVRQGAALRLKKEGYLFIYAAGPGQVYLQYRLDTPARSTRLIWRFNDISAETHLIEGRADLVIGPLPLQRGLNYFRLSTEPAQELEFLTLSVQPQKN